MLQAALEMVLPHWKTGRACTSERPKGLLAQLTERQRKLAFEYTGNVNSWDDDVPAQKQAQAA